MRPISDLHSIISRVCPIDGVSVGNIGDPTTWRIDFRPEATLEQREQAMVALAAFSFDEKPVQGGPVVVS